MKASISNVILVTRVSFKTKVSRLMKKMCMKGSVCELFINNARDIMNKHSESEEESKVERRPRCGRWTTMAREAWALSVRFLNLCWSLSLPTEGERYLLLTATRVSSLVHSHA